MDSIVSIQDINKIYDSGHRALKDINLEIKRGEIFGLLGPNGAGKTTLISVICGIVNATSGRILVDGHDTQEDFRAARALIGLVPQELTADMFEKVWDTVSFSRGLFGKTPNPELIESILKDLSLWDKKDNQLRTLSGGMKRRVLIAKALSHEPKVLFLDEPTAGVDVQLRKAMWETVHRLRDAGVTIILTTHYIEEAEEMADRIGVIRAGEIILVEDKKVLMHKLGRKELHLELREPLDTLPDGLSEFDLTLSDDGLSLNYIYDRSKQHTGINALLESLNEAGIPFRDIETQQSSLEDIFVDLVKEHA